VEGNVLGKWVVEGYGLYVSGSIPHRTMLYCLLLPTLRKTVLSLAAPDFHVARVVMEETKLIKDLTSCEGFARLGIAKLATLLVRGSVR
jgi:hypothetical protein